MNCGDDECMTEKTEAKEFAYFSGITTGRNGERNRIIDLLRDHMELAYIENHAKDGTMHQDHCELCQEYNGLAVAEMLIKGVSK
jgi:hypothetical protein